MLRPLHNKHDDSFIFLAFVIYTDLQFRTRLEIRRRKAILESGSVTLHVMLALLANDLGASWPKCPDIEVFILSYDSGKRERLAFSEDGGGLTGKLSVG